MKNPEEVADRGTPAGKLCVVRSQGGPVLEFAAQELAELLGRMLSDAVPVKTSTDLRGARIVVSYGATGARLEDWSGSGYAIVPGRDGIVLCGVDERSVLDAVYRLMRDLGATFPLGAPALFQSIDRTRLGELAPVEVRPAFSRRCLVSDIMTWHYAEPERFAMHLEHDRQFIPWMARNGLNAFFYIRHAFDTQYRIPELGQLLAERGIDVEYGGHVIQQLLPREHFADHPEYFPAGANGARMQMGNLCVSNPGALDMVRTGALDYLGQHPHSRLLHVWGADVRKGAWCMCDQCSQIAPQLQYLKLVNAIAAVAADGCGPDKTPPAMSYLAYHDTLEPVAGMSPLANVWFEWAPRERCYSHAIDDPRCETNPRYFAALKRYVELFEGRGHVFEYYADAILFGGMGFATPSVIAQDLRAYRAVGLSSVSCLTFGAFSVFAYPVNLLAFARLAVNPDDSAGASGGRGRGPTSSRVPLGNGGGVPCGAARLRAHADLWRGAAAVDDLGSPASASICKPRRSSCASRSMLPTKFAAIPIVWSKPSASCGDTGWRRWLASTSTWRRGPAINRSSASSLRWIRCAARCKRCAKYKATSRARGAASISSGSIRSGWRNCAAAWKRPRSSTTSSIVMPRTIYPRAFCSFSYLTDGILRESSFVGKGGIPVKTKWLKNIIKSKLSLHRFSSPRGALAGVRRSSGRGEVPGRFGPGREADLRHGASAGNTNDRYSRCDQAADAFPRVSRKGQTRNRAGQRESSG